jgi:hypothetical protein
MNQNVTSPEVMINILKDRDFEIASGFIQTAVSLDCRYDIRYATAHRIWKCAFSKQKPKRVLFMLECNENRWYVKVNLFHIDQYRQVVESCSDEIRNRIKTAYDCKMCSPRCKGGAEFLLDNQKYKKCKGCCFYFSDMADNDWSCLQTLIRSEAMY